MGNYRPVSLTSVACKVMDSIVRDELVTHMITNGLFADEQHGFSPGRSCITQLLYVLEEWTEMLDCGKPVDVVYMDFQKAFDSVPHRRLLSKLKSYGITGKVWKWIECFLTGHQQRVSVNGKKSEWSEVQSGIPQGSVRPTLFVIFINGMPGVVKNNFPLFADDAKLYGAVQNEKDARGMQDDITRLVNWSEKWQLSFNCSKCKVMHLGRSNQKTKYSMNGNELEEVEEEKDLGVIVDNQLKFHAHVSSCVNKDNRVLGAIKRTFIHREKEVIIPAYVASVRSLLEYGNVIWHPAT